MPAARDSRGRFIKGSGSASRSKRTVVGFEQLESLLAAQPEIAREAAASALHAEANNMMGESKKIVPHDLGALMNSGVVGDPEINGDVVTVELGYGGAASAYAIVQHEDMSLRHDPGRSAKYLERPVMAAADNLGHNIRARMAEKLF